MLCNPLKILGDERQNGSFFTTWRSRALRSLQLMKTSIFRCTKIQIKDENSTKFANCARRVLGGGCLDENSLFNHILSVHFSHFCWQIPTFHFQLFSFSLFYVFFSILIFKFPLFKFPLFKFPLSDFNFQVSTFQVCFVCSLLLEFAVRFQFSGFHL